MNLLALLFFVTALLYAAAGFGGGSTYNALLVLSDTPYAAVPIISLMCNIVVVTVGSWRFAASGHIDFRRIWPLFAASVPLSWLGGRLHVPVVLFVGLLAVSLFAAGLLMLLRKPEADEPPQEKRRIWLEPLIGGMLGLLSGIVGIGGGIYLAPILHVLRWGEARAIAGTSAVFILVNSIAGLAGQLMKGGGLGVKVLTDHWLLFPAVLVGGLIGSALGSDWLPSRYVRLLTAILVLYAAARLGIRFYGLMNGSTA
jgi:uncharacterized membrane protein YfcA